MGTQIPYSSPFWCVPQYFGLFGYLPNIQGRGTFCPKRGQPALQYYNTSRWPRNLIGPDDMFLVTPVAILKVASLFIFSPSNTNEMHFVGFNVMSRSWQELDISCRALPWSSEVDEIIVTSSTNLLTLCSLESPIAAVGFTGRLLASWAIPDLSVPQTGYHLRSVSLIV